MADLVPQNFPIPQETAIASYDFVDISEGVGTVRYVGSRIQVDATSGNDEFILTTKTDIIGQEVSGEFKTEIGASNEFNFDVTFNTPKTVDGRIMGFIPIENAASTSATPRVRILKWDGSSETELVAQVTYQATPGTNGNYVSAVAIDTSNEKFKAGETLRIEVVITAASNVHLQHDPTGSISASPSGGILSWLVPFKLDL